MFEDPSILFDFLSFIGLSFVFYFQLVHILVIFVFGGGVDFYFFAGVCHHEFDFLYLFLPA